MTFAVYEVCSDGKEHTEYKTFSISKEDNDKVLSNIGWSCYIGNGIADNGILLVMFSKLYNFSIGPNGFRIEWDEDENGNKKRFSNGYVSWVGPRPPAAQIGGKWWKICRVV